MNAQRLRNLTTGRLHTDIGHIYEDIEFITGKKGVMIHMLPNACRAMEPWLREQVKDSRFWDGLYDTTHIGEFPLQAMDADAKKAFWQRYDALPSLLEGKEVLAVVVD